MNTDKIRQCRFCGIHTEFDVQDIGDDSYRAICKTCGTRGPLVGSAGGAIEAWQEMMAPRAHDPIMTFDKDGNIRMLEKESSYRDRVDRIVAACVMSSWTSDWQADQIVKYAMVVIDAIDKALAEQEGK